jgi:hypothetical protein
MRWYYPPRLGLDLSEGYETFVKQDDTVDEHLDTLLDTIIDHEQKTMQRMNAHVATWRGVLTKVCRLRGPRLGFLLTKNRSCLPRTRIGTGQIFFVSHLWSFG